MPLGTDVGLDPGHIVLVGDPGPPKGHSLQILAHVCCRETAGWIKMPLGMDVGLGSGDIVLDGDPVPLFSAYVYCGQTVAHLSYC